MCQSINQLHLGKNTNGNDSYLFGVGKHFKGLHKFTWCDSWWVSCCDVRVQSLGCKLLNLRCEYIFHSCKGLPCRIFSWCHPLRRVYSGIRCNSWVSVVVCAVICHWCSYTWRQNKPAIQNTSGIVCHYQFRLKKTQIVHRLKTDSMAWFVVPSVIMTTMTQWWSAILQLN